MPLYEYRCEACGHTFELIQRFSADPPDSCPACQAGPIVKLLSSPAFQFKGTGWYITDYARKGEKGGQDGKGEKGDGPKAQGDGADKTQGEGPTAKGEGPEKAKAEGPDKAKGQGPSAKGEGPAAKGPAVP